MSVLGLRRDPLLGRGAADAVQPMSALKSLLPEADFVALTCPLTPETENLIDADALARMKAAAYLVNVARGRRHYVGFCAACTLRCPACSSGQRRPAGRQLRQNRSLGRERLILANPDRYKSTMRIVGGE